MFHVGQKVVCVKLHCVGMWAECQIPEVGSIYTVRGLDDTDGVLLEEITNTAYEFCIDVRTGRTSPGEPSWLPDHFRPLVERKLKTDISIFKKMLMPNKELVE